MLGFAPLGGAPLGGASLDSTGGGGDASDAITITDVLDGQVSNLNGVLADGLQLDDPAAVTWTARGLIADILELQDGTYQGAQEFNEVDAELADKTRLTDAADIRRAQIVALADAIHVADVLLGYYGAVVTETILARERLLGNGVFGVFGTEVMRLAEQARLGVPVTAADGLTLAGLLDAKSAVLLVEALRIAEMMQGSALYNVSLRQSVRLADSLARFFSGDIADTLAVAELLVAMGRAVATAADAVEMQDTLAPRFLLAVTAADGVTITPEQAVAMLYAPELVEGVEINAGYLEPDGSFTTWAMNTRTGAVTEYQNYAFNSLARVGNRCFGASDTGLYELLGDTDAGDPIIASIKSGYLQFGGTQLSRVKEAYIAARGEGRFILRVRTADGLLWDYGVDTRSMRSTKVHMGKGQRSRYFSFELISTGQDFDLDTLEFVPIVMQRRV